MSCFRAQWDVAISWYRKSIGRNHTHIHTNSISRFHCSLQGKFSTKSDVWSFAITLWEILTFAREQPFEHFSDEKVVENFGHIYKDDKKHVSNISQHYYFHLVSWRQMKKKMMKKHTTLSRLFQIFIFNLKSHCLVFLVDQTWTSFVIKFLRGHIHASFLFSPATTTTIRKTTFV